MIPEFIDVALIARGLAALAVVWWHAEGYLEKTSAEARVTIPGRLAVWIFFVLSGYLIGSGFADGRYTSTFRSLMRFYQNRWLRIYPLFFVVALISYFVSRSLGHPLPTSIGDFAREFGMLQWNQSYLLNGVFWTLGIEAQFYLLAPLLFLTQLKTPYPKFVGLLIYGLFIFAFRWDESLLHHGGDSRTLLGNLVHFQTGFLVCLYRPWIHWVRPRFDRWGALFALLIALIGLLGASQLFFDNNFKFLHLDGMLLVDSVGFSILFAHVLMERAGVRAGLLTVPLLMLGTLSYGLYAWHGALLVRSSFQSKFGLLLLFSLTLAILSYRLVERPALRLKSRSQPQMKRVN